MENLTLATAEPICMGRACPAVAVARRHECSSLRGRSLSFPLSPPEDANKCVCDGCVALHVNKASNNIILIMPTMLIRGTAILGNLWL